MRSIAVIRGFRGVGGCLDELGRPSAVQNTICQVKFLSDFGEISLKY